jgi:hypothetical protein
MSKFNENLFPEMGGGFIQTGLHNSLILFCADALPLVRVSDSPLYMLATVAINVAIKNRVEMTFSS